MRLYLDQLGPISEPRGVSVLRLVACGTGRGKGGQTDTWQATNYVHHGYASIHEGTRRPTDRTTSGNFDGKILPKTWKKFLSNTYLVPRFWLKTGSMWNLSRTPRKDQMQRGDQVGMCPLMTSLLKWGQRLHYLAGSSHLSVWDACCLSLDMAWLWWWA